MKHLLGSLLGVVLLGGLFTFTPAAGADTPGCVSQGEYGNLTRYLSVGQVQGRFDTGGWYIGSDADEFRRGYNACFSTDRVVVWYSLITGLSTRWDVRP